MRFSKAYGLALPCLMVFGSGCSNDCPAGLDEVQDARGTRTLCLARYAAQTTGTGGETTGAAGTEESGTAVACESGACAVCGDEVVEGKEECDNGVNNSKPWQLMKPEDGACAPGCLVVGWCGDGVHTGHEECDNGANVDAAWQSVKPAEGVCAPGCVAVGWCGDGTQNGPEECDNGTNMDNPWEMTKPMSGACADGCVAVGWCGDGAVNGPEACDDGNQVDTDECSNECVTPRIVFVTSGRFVGKLGGLAGADDKCATAAGDALLGAGPWRAWLSNGTQGPADRFDTEFVGWYRLPDGTPIAKGWAEITDGSLDAAINLTEKGMEPEDPKVVWSNSATSGHAVVNGNHCSNWSSNEAVGEKGRFGDSTAKTGDWTDVDAMGDNPIGCSASHRLYCFQDSR